MPGECGENKKSRKSRALEYNFKEVSAGSDYTGLICTKIHTDANVYIPQKSVSTSNVIYEIQMASKYFSCQLHETERNP